MEKTKTLVKVETVISFNSDGDIALTGYTAVGQQILAIVPQSQVFADGYALVQL